jgi:hypothetical protein
VQFRFLPALVVFVGSYLPLAVILLAQNVNFGVFGGAFCWPVGKESCQSPLRNPTLSLGFLLLTLTCFVLTLAILKLVKPTQQIVVLESKYIPVDLMNYTLPYIVSFMSVDYGDAGKYVGFLVFLAWMFWITLRSGQIVLNPVLIALGWRLYEVKYRFASTDNVHVTRALTKADLSAGPAKQWPVQDIQIVDQEGA